MPRFIALYLIFSALVLEGVVLPEWGMGIDDSEEIIVTLKTDNPFKTIYLSSVLGEGFEPSYLKELDRLLAFDFSHSGSTDLLPREAGREAALARNKVSAQAIGGVETLLLPRIEDNRLRLEIYRSTPTPRIFLGPELSGSLAHDRRALHRFTDRVIEEQFGGSGWAETRLLYTLRLPENDGSYSSEVWAIERDGSGARAITAKGGYCVTPYSVGSGPEGGPRFFYVSYKKGEPRIYYADVDRRFSQPILELRGNQLMPAFSPSSGLLACVCDVAGNPDLFVQPYSLENGVEGPPRQLFTARQGTQGSPSFDPTGQEVAFVSNKDGSPKIYTLSTSPQRGQKVKPKLISVRAKNGTAPSWSPDGKKIAFCSRTAGFRQIWIADLERGEEYPITEGKGHKENPVWAPDSLHLFYNSANPDEAELFLIDIIRRKPLQLTSGRGEKRFPSVWRAE